MLVDSLFVETMSRAISDYRQILKNYLTPKERAAKIAQLRLRDITIYDDEPALYQVVQDILADIEANIQLPNEGYYSYYGIVRFSKFLREYIDNYLVEGDQVIHKAKKASNLLIEVIQLLSVSGQQLTPSVARHVIESHPLIVQFATNEQLAIYENALGRLKEKNESFYRQVIEDFHAQKQDLVEVA